MTVPMLNELNDADLAWAASDPSMAGVIGQLLDAHRAVGTGRAVDTRRAHDRAVIEPALLRARGAL